MDTSRLATVYVVQIYSSKGGFTLDITNSVNLSTHEVEILRFLRSMGAFAGRNGNRSGEGVSLSDINSFFNNCEKDLDGLTKKNCICEDRITGYNSMSAPVQIPCYYIKPVGALSLYVHENQ